MHIVDNLSEINKIDSADVRSSIGLFPDQCLQALDDTNKLTIPKIPNIKNVVVCGMGGSAFAAEIVKTLFFEELTIPVEIVRNYKLPNYINSDSLVIISSYSGSTEESISCAFDALKRKSAILYLCKKDNSKLTDFALKNNIFGYQFIDKYNPCGQPRLGTGYLVFGLIGMLLKCGLIEKYNFSKIQEIINKIKKLSAYDLKHTFDNNPAKQMAVKLVNKFVILVGSEFLEGAIHGFANQLNETAKTNSSYHIIPEMNHHRMEGLLNPRTFKNNSIFIFYPSNLYLERNYVRYNITKKIIEKNGYDVLEHNLMGNNKIEQTLETIIFNSYVSFYLAILYKIDPCKIPWVDYFKNELKKVR